MSASVCPFPGPASYDYEGRNTFFGREKEVVAFGSMLMGRQLTVLTAGSGDGKTSLIHAGLAPLLFREGVEVAVAEPGGRAPLAALGQACLLRLLQPRRAGRRIVMHLIRHLGEDSTLGVARTFVLTELDRGERQKLLTRREARRPVDMLLGGPLASWLRDPDVPEEYLTSAMNAVRLPSDGAGEGARWPGVRAPLKDVLSFFDGWEHLPTPRSKDAPDEAAETLMDALGSAIERRSAFDPSFELALVIDQFEEIFTLFRGRPGSEKAEAQNWRHREALIIFLRQVRTRRWPLHIVLSLRKEHYADLQAALAEPEGLAGMTYHLGPLTIAQAVGCLSRPGIWRETALSSDQADAVVDALTVEGQFVHSTLLSVVGEWLWLTSNLASLSPEALRTSVPGAIDRFVRRAFEDRVDGTVWSPSDRREALEMLNQLIIREAGEARRNSVAESALIFAPFRNARLRRRLMVELQSRRLIRIESRLGGYYVEIVHEQLIGALQAYMEDMERQDAQFSALSQLLDDLQAEGQSPLCRPLDKASREALTQNIGRIELHPAMAARTFARMILDSDLFDSGEDVSNSNIDGRRARSKSRSVIKETLVSLADLAECPEDVEIESYGWNRRARESLLVSPAEADRRAAEPMPASLLSFVLGCTLLHQDEGRRGRIRHYASRLRDLEVR